MVTPLQIRTRRLLLRRFQMEDIPAFLSYRNDEEVSRFDGTHGMTRGEAREFIEEQSCLPAGEPNRWLQIAVEAHSAGLIGDCGFRVDGDTVGTAEIGYRLGREHWRKGYASEAVAGVIDWAFESLGLHRVVAIIDTRNTRSIALAERLGFRREAHFVENYREPDGWSDEYLYALLDREWYSRDQVDEKAPRKSGRPALP
jgi:ribosomal-protein-alanine N-acetyltransferase